jgi:signal transduction histidine kinase
LFSLNMQLAIVRQLQEEGALDEANQVIDEISSALQEAVQVTRSLSVSLSPLCCTTRVCLRPFAGWPD